MPGTSKNRPENTTGKKYSISDNCRMRMKILPHNKSSPKSIPKKNLPKVKQQHTNDSLSCFLAFWGTFATMQKLQGNKSNVLSLKRWMLYFEDLWDAWHPLRRFYLDPAYTVALALPTPGREGGSFRKPSTRKPSGTNFIKFQYKHSNKNSTLPKKR